jgi:HAD superfamily hydrolase (TIGR01509 family)
VLFDVGETLVDETRLWSGWAQRLGVSAGVMFAVLGSVIERRLDHRVALELLRGPDGQDDLGGPAAVDDPFPAPRDLYPDARRCVQSLRAGGYRVAVAGNQPASFHGLWREAGVELDVLSSSEELGAAKPDPAFFLRLAALVGVAPMDCVYVGDRVDNDILPAAEAGLAPIFVRRGPWGFVQAGWPGVERAAARIDSLDELPSVLAAIGGASLAG